MGTRVPSESSIGRSLPLVRLCLGIFPFVPKFLFFPDFLLLVLFFCLLLPLASPLLFGACSHARSILCEIHTLCMRSPFPIVHAEWFHVFRFLQRICSLVHNNNRISTIHRSFKISYFSRDLMYFSYSSFNLSILVRMVQLNLAVDLLHGISCPIAFLIGTLYFIPIYPICQFCTTGGNEMCRDCIAPATIQTRRQQWTLLPSFGVIHFCISQFAWFVI